MANNRDNAKKGIGLPMVLFLIFLVLKLANVGTVATWSWWWVCSPLWIPSLLFLTFVLIGLFFTVLSRLLG